MVIAYSDQAAGARGFRFIYGNLKHNADGRPRNCSRSLPLVDAMGRFMMLFAVNIM